MSGEVENLILYSFMGDLPNVMIFAEALGNVNFRGISGLTPLTAALYKKHHNVAFYLLSVGANPNAKTVFGKSSVFGNKNELREYKIFNPAPTLGSPKIYGNLPGMSPLILTSRSQTIFRLLQGGADVNLTGNVYFIDLTHIVSPPIGQFINFLRPDNFQRFLTFNPNLEQLSSFGYTALYNGLERNRSENVRAILEAGANPFIPVPQTNEGNLFLLGEYQWRKLFTRDRETSLRRAGATFPSDIWLIILLDLRLAQLCNNQERNRYIIYHFARSYNIPVEVYTPTARMCALISGQITFGVVYEGRPEREILEAQRKTRQLALQFNLDTSQPIEGLLIQLSRLLKEPDQNFIVL